MLDIFMMTAHATILLGVKKVETIFARLLGQIHGLIGLTQKLIGVDVVGLREEGDAHAGRYLQRQITHRHRFGRRSQQTV